MAVNPAAKNSMSCAKLADTDYFDIMLLQWTATMPLGLRLCSLAGRHFEEQFSKESSLAARASVNGCNGAASNPDNTFSSRHDSLRITKGKSMTRRTKRMRVPACFPRSFSHVQQVPSHGMGVIRMKLAGIEARFDSRRRKRHAFRLPPMLASTCVTVGYRTQPKSTKAHRKTSTGPCLTTHPRSILSSAKRICFWIGCGANFRLALSCLA